MGLTRELTQQEIKERFAPEKKQVTITAKYPGRCARCGNTIPAGTQVNWNKNTKNIAHIGTCPASQPVIQTIKVEPYKLYGGSGDGCQGWAVGQVVKNPKKGKGEPEYLTVVTAAQQYYKEDGLSFGVGDESGYAYQATARPATDKEAASIKAEHTAAATKREAWRTLETLVHHIQTVGKRPAGQHTPEGEIVPVENQTMYNRGSWLVVGREHIWYVENASADNWKSSNIITGRGVGAIGWRVPTTTELIATCAIIKKKLAES